MEINKRHYFRFLEPADCLGEMINEDSVITQDVERAKEIMKVEYPDNPSVHTNTEEVTLYVK